VAVESGMGFVDSPSFSNGSDMWYTADAMVEAPTRAARCDAPTLVPT